MTNENFVPGPSKPENNKVEIPAQSTDTAEVPKYPPQITVLDTRSILDLVHSHSKDDSIGPSSCTVPGGLKKFLRGLYDGSQGATTAYWAYLCFPAGFYGFYFLLAGFAAGVAKTGMKVYIESKEDASDDEKGKLYEVVKKICQLTELSTQELSSSATILSYLQYINWLAELTKLPAFAVATAILATMTSANVYLRKQAETKPNDQVEIIRIVLNDETSDLPQTKLKQKYIAIKEAISSGIRKAKRPVYLTATTAYSLGITGLYGWSLPFYVLNTAGSAGVQISNFVQMLSQGLACGVYTIANLSNNSYVDQDKIRELLIYCSPTLVEYQLKLGLAINSLYDGLNIGFIVVQAPLDGIIAATNPNFNIPNSIFYSIIATGGLVTVTGGFKYFYENRKDMYIDKELDDMEKGLLSKPTVNYGSVNSNKSPFFSTKTVLNKSDSSDALSDNDDIAEPARLEYSDSSGGEDSDTALSDYEFRQ